jgi:hypothetical protein
MLKIKNIEKIVGMYANGREIVEAGDYGDNTLRKIWHVYYFFKIQKQGDSGDYNKEHDIVLTKQRGPDGKYRMFNMGLQRATEIEVDMKNINQPQDFCIAIRNILIKTQTFYKNN